ncbi:MAG: hypothetical protein A2Y06_02225 [Omnitrophica WOR_2 bacterium GWA2_37_7]|nr:MAG: hypothetical protein A2Y06_02225 [Omnitrophica WOR_2 bacterium GWA2_37_7]
MYFIMINRNSFLFALSIFLICFTAIPYVIFAENNLFELPQDKVLVFIGQDNKTIETYIDQVGHQPDGFMLYTSIQKVEGLIAPSPDYGSGIGYADGLMTKYPKASLQLGLYMVDALKDVYQGAYDDNIEIIADWFKTKNVPIYLRIGYEFDGPHNHYDPRDYIKAYRYLVDCFRRSGVTNVAYVWHSYGYEREEPILNWYPGDEYVDWVGISCFTLPNFFIGSIVEFANDHKKPVMIAEGTPRGYGVHKGRLSWEAWFKIMFSLVKKYDIKAISYINSNWEGQSMWAGQGWGDARIEANDFVKESWLKEVQRISKGDSP